MRVRMFLTVQIDLGLSSLTDRDRPISTYNGQGLAKPGLIKGQHCIVYAGKEDDEPDELPGEKPAKGEKGMMSSIRVVPRNVTDRMFAASRINFGKVYTVEHNVKVYDFGSVHRKYVTTLEKQWKSVVNVTKHSEVVPPRLPIHGTALHPYTGTLEGYLTFAKDDRILVMAYPTDDWAKGRNESTGFDGLFPSKNYVQLDNPDHATAIKDNPYNKDKRDRLVLNRGDRITRRDYVNQEWDLGYNIQTKKEGRYNYKWVKMDGGRYAIAIQEVPFDPNNPGQLTLAEGDRIFVTQWDASQVAWSRGRNERTRQEGFFAAGHVELK
jgi:hypothetical protein